MTTVKVKVTQPCTSVEVKMSAVDRLVPAAILATN